MEKATAKNPSKAPLQGIHVLIVDDAFEMLYLLRAFLEKAGAKVSEALSVTEAVTRALRDRPDVIITDITMQDGDGYDLIAKVRALAVKGKTPIPIAALTAHTDDLELEKISAAGFDAQLTKPVSARELVSSVHRMMHRSLPH